MPARNVEWYYFQGKSSWAKVQQPDLEFKNWNIRVYLKPESIDLFNKLKEPEGDVEGILNELKEDEDGKFATFRRPMVKNWGRGDEHMTPPEVLDADGEVLSKDKLIGNGSDVTVKVECYKFRKPFKKGMGKAIRLVAVRVDNLVPYSREDYTPEQEKAVQGLDGQPKQLF